MDSNVKRYRGIENSSLFVYNQNILYVRKTLFVCIVLFSGFALLDFLIYPELFKSFLIIRFGIVIPYMILVIAFSYTKYFKKYNQLLILSIYVLAGIGIITMIFLIEGTNYYYGGLYLVFATGFYLIKLKWFYSMVGFISIMLFFIIGGISFNHLSVEEVFVHSFFYFSFAVIGGFGGFFIDNYITSMFEFETNSIITKQLYEKEITNQLKKINLQLEEINNSHESTITSIATLAESRDRLTGDHLNRVGELSYILSNQISNETYDNAGIKKEEFINSIKLASVLHDIGKISVSDKILNKPGKLTEEEYNIIKTHSLIGANTLESIRNKNTENSYVNLGIKIAKSHHERWDGTGYPHHLRGEEIPFSARIVAIIDVYDALVSVRPYKDRFSKAKSIRIIKEGLGTQFDPYLAQTFIDIANNSNDEALFWR